MQNKFKRLDGKVMIKFQHVGANPVITFKLMEEHKLCILKKNWDSWLIQKLQFGIWVHRHAIFQNFEIGMHGEGTFQEF